MSAELRVVTDPATERQHRTEQILEAQIAASQFIARHGLRLHSIAYERRLLKAATEVSVSLYRDPAGFLDWCVALGVDRVRVHRRDYDVTLNNPTAMTPGLEWRISGSLARPAGDALPGIPAPWRRLRSGRLGNEGVITVDELRAVLHHLNGETA